MAKLVILDIGPGSFEQGFPVTLQIGEEGTIPTIRKTGHLPPAPEMPLYYHRWQSHYKELDQIYRLSAVANPPPANVSRSQLVKKCQNLSGILQSRLNDWIRTPEFQEIRATWFKAVNAEDVVRAIVQVGDREMQQLPWHLLDLVQGYAQLEIAIGSSFEQPFTKPIPHPTVNILAILGDSRGIDTQKDAAILEQLPKTEVEFLVEPQRSQLSDRLWDRPWDVLFFAGHSASQQDYESGVIYLNPTDKLTVSELKLALRKAVERGLKLAIFNSCDGLGLARELADLHIPQVIVMREPVPDRVAQVFLQYFLQAYSQGEPLYLAVRQARERLEGLEDQFPCATWLPMIFQNLAAVPPLWKSPISPQNPPALPHFTPRSLRLPQVVLSSVVVTMAIAGGRYLGWFQPLELKAFDHAMQVRLAVHPEKWDDRILVVAIDDAAFKEEERSGNKLADKSISDASLLKLIGILAQGKPAAIGMDLQRDSRGVPLPVVKAFQRASTPPTGKLVGTCLGTYGKMPGFAPPAGVTAKQIGFADTPQDDDQVIRRHLLFQTPPEGSACPTPYSLSLKLALQYLSQQGIQENYDPDLQLGRTTFTALKELPGGYQREQRLNQLGGSLVLLNYRAQLPQSIPMSDVLRGRLTPEQIRDRLILIGVTRTAGPDFHETPQGRVPGVFIQAQMTSQIISAALDKRPLLRVWHPWLEVMWIGGWAAIGGLLIWRLPPGLPRWIGFASAVLVLYGGCLLIFIQAYWVPLIPAGLGLVLSSGSLALSQVGVAAAHKRRRSTVNDLT